MHGTGSRVEGSKPCLFLLINPLLRAPSRLRSRSTVHTSLLIRVPKEKREWFPYFSMANETDETGSDACPTILAFDPARAWSGPSRAPATTLRSLFASGRERPRADL